jgi:acetoin utilization protein AcuC
MSNRIIIIRKQKREGSVMKTGIIYSNKLKNYDFGSGHPFRGDRFESFMSYFNTELSESGKFEILLNEEAASDNDLELWHTKDYIQAMQRASAGLEVSNLLNYISGDNVNPLTRQFPLGIETAARVIVKNAILACELVQEGKYEKAVSIGGGFHHAKPSYGEGFCVYNDVVISAKYAIRKYALERILILDTDAHAGNGTCQAFYSDPRVLFVDIHQKYIYPGTGYEDEIGEGKGKGYTVNVPLPPYASDEAYKFVFNELIFPLVEEFNPQFVIRNGGSDPHPSDQITQLGLTLDGFRYIGKSVREIAEICDGKEADLVCSGYKPQVLSRAWSALIAGLAGVDISLEEPFPLRIKKTQMLGEAKKLVKKVKRNLKPYWRNIRH